MFRTRPPGFAIVCICVWLLQLALLAMAFYGHPEEWQSDQQRWGLAALVTSVGLGALLLTQLPRALQWRPRLNARASADVLAERRRIARDLHDNLGSQLVCALALLNTSNPRESGVHSALEKCLLDLRLIVDSMHSVEAPLADRLAQLRYRIAPVLAQRGIRMQWDVETPSCANFLYPESAMHLVAIVQEALSNALQHANATEIQVNTRCLSTPGAWCVEVCDNGQGFLPPFNQEDCPELGHGMAGMARRASLAGGELQVFAAQRGGTCIRVVAPYAAVP